MRRVVLLAVGWAAGFVVGATLAFTRRGDIEEEMLAPGVYGSRAGLRVARDDEEQR